jgi:hypothetical protein
MIQAFAAIGEVLVFPVIQAAVIRRLGWSSFGEAEAAKVKRMFLSR